MRDANDIIFATCLEQPDLQPSDKLTAAALERLGYRVIAAPWNGPFDAFQTGSAIVIRSTWDYPETPSEFADWLARLDAVAGPVFNHPSLLRWNLSKRYLARLIEAGVTLPPTRFVSPSAVDIGAAMAELGVAQAVVKPIISASGKGLSIAHADQEDSLRVAAERLGGRSALVQPVLAEIHDPGETSFVFIDGIFAHAVTKRPKSGSILCQEEHGGNTEIASPPRWTIDEARRILGLLPAIDGAAPLYARVDAIASGDQGVDGRFMLMEVEVIEPELFFTHAPASADAFAAALIKRLS